MRSHLREPKRIASKMPEQVIEQVIAIQTPGVPSWYFIASIQASGNLISQEQVIVIHIGERVSPAP